MTRSAVRRQALRVSGLLMGVTVLVLSAAPGAGATIAGPVKPAVVHRPPHASRGPAVHGVYPVRSHFRKPRNQADRRYVPRAVHWPAAATARLALAAPAMAGRQGTVARAAGTPVWAQATAGGTAASRPRTLDVRVLGRRRARAAGVNGVLFAVSATGGGQGEIRVGLDYRGFAQAYGGNYGSRLVLSELPGCALSTPARPACQRAVPLRSVNNWARQEVSAPISVTGANTAFTGSVPGALPAVNTVVLTATSSDTQEGGAAGTYAATTLKPSGTWSGGGSTGSFAYSYPIAAPPAASSLVPDVALSYNSTSVDGQTASTAAQASWAGDGWSTGDSFIEQSFISCADKPEGTASPVSTTDECYDGPVLTMSLDGASTNLVCNSAETSCKLSADNGAVIKHVTNSGNGTGTYNTDYWTITERDGTVYEFGRNELPGWASGKPTTNSVDSLPVFSAHSGDPCYSSSGFASSVCTMAYRWNLDYVKDPHGNAMAYYYNQATNYYGEDNGAKNVPYIRSSNLSHIDYGFTDGNAYGTVPDKIVFSTGDRCVSGTCDPLNSTTAPNWPDVPFDLICNAGTTCTSSQRAPSFFSTVRLTGISAEQYSTASASYVTVDSYALNETLPATGDGTSPTLWLNSITHTGSDTTAGGSSSPITLAPVTFTGIDLQNRVDTVTDGLPPLYRFRIATITTETGSVISPTYGQANPCTAPVTITPSANTSSCYPVYWTPAGYTAPFLDWFNDYVVTSVSQTDPTGGAPVQMTSYKYLGGAAWHYDDNEVVQPKYRTYGQFRGYGDVQTLTGDGVNDPKTLSETTYYRGMSDDNNSTTVTLTDSAGGTHEDLDQLAGQVLETTSYLGNGGPVDHSTITSYWVSAATATRTRSGLPDLTANWIAPAEVYTRQAITDGGTTHWQYTETDTSYDATASDPAFGLATHVYTHTVPANTVYDRCTTTTYAPANTSANLVGLPAETETDSVACGGFTEGSPASVPSGFNTLTAPASVNRPDQVVADSRTFYDDPSYATTFPQPSAPTKGDSTMTEQASGYSGGAFGYQITGKTAYDSYGRPVTVFDANGNKTTTSYTMNSVGLTTASTVTNPLGQATTSTDDPERGLVLTSTDANGVLTTEHYDALGRLTGVWDASRATTSPANYKFSYAVSNTGVTAVTTQKLNDESGYQTSVEIYDAMLRPRQTQADTPQGGRMVTDTFYDSRGWVSAKYNGWWDPSTTPNTTLVSAANLQAEVPSQDYYTYDGLGRVVIDNSEKDNQVVSTTTTVYNGDRVTVIPPAGGVTKATATDPLGRTTEVDEYTSAPTLNTPSNTFTGIFSVSGGTDNATRYGYDTHGNQATITDANNDNWTASFDLLGHATSKTDPVSGTTSFGYDGNGNVIQTTDARGKTVSYTYDALNRRTGEYDAPVGSQSASNELASWAYDNSNNAVPGMTYPIGHLTTETAYSGGNAYTTQQSGFNIFGESTGETVTIPSAEGALGGSYKFSHIYTGTTGLLLKDIYPAAGGLPSETVLHGYATNLDLPTTLNGLSGYSQGVTYDAYSRVNQETIGSSPDLAYLTDSYDIHTGNLTDQLVTRAVSTPANVDEESYGYDLAGNITSQASTRLGAAATSETQCFAYDQLDRLTAAWTATDSCATQPSASNSSMVGDNLGASSAYWTTWGFDAVGNRISQVQHSTTGGADTATSYGYNGNGAGQPGTLTSTSTTGGSSGTTSYAYDPAGNMTSRNAGQGSQTLTWNDAGLLSSITGGTAGDSSFVYDAGGILLLEKDPGSTTLYLPSEQITLASSGATTGVRYYQLPGGGIAYRTGSGTAYGFEITDQHGTPFLSLDNTAQIPTWRQFTPYGAPRGATVSWFDNHGFLNKPTDASTGLTDIGARQYDPTTSRFISLDPVLETTSPQELNGYTYAGDNPVTQSDPSGLMLPGGSQCGILASEPCNGGGGGGGGGGSSSGICYYCHYAPPQYTGGGGGGGGGYHGGGGGGICYYCYAPQPSYSPGYNTVVPYLPGYHPPSIFLAPPAHMTPPKPPTTNSPWSPLWSVSCSGRGCTPSNVGATVGGLGAASYPVARNFAKLRVLSRLYNAPTNDLPITQAMSEPWQAARFARALPRWASDQAQSLVEPGPWASGAVKGLAVLGGGIQAYGEYNATNGNVAKSVAVGVADTGVNVLSGYGGAAFGEAVVTAGISVAGSVFGGTETGAAIGTMLGGPVGTVVGAVVGAAVGAALAIGVGNAVNNFINSIF
jgi:RHS repeat-associated protein